MTSVIAASRPSSTAPSSAPMLRSSMAPVCVRRVWAMQMRTSVTFQVVWSGTVACLSPSASCLRPATSPALRGTTSGSWRARFSSVRSGPRRHARRGVSRSHSASLRRSSGVSHGADVTSTLSLSIRAGSSGRRTSASSLRCWARTSTSTSSTGTNSAA